jgi:hypothetical protein
MAEGEATSYRWTLDQARKNNDKSAIKALEKMGHHRIRVIGKQKPLQKEGFWFDLVARFPEVGLEDLAW